MKISEKNIIKLRNRIESLQSVLDGIEINHPMNVTCGIGAIMSSIGHTLDEIEYEYRMEESGYMSYEKFIETVSHEHPMAHFYSQFKTHHDDRNMAGKEFYMKHIEFLNIMFKQFDK